MRKPFTRGPSDRALSQAITNGCVRVPSDALTTLSKVPLGTLVHIKS